jgi:hypothetical protein
MWHQGGRVAMRVLVIGVIGMIVAMLVGPAIGQQQPPSDDQFTLQKEIEKRDQEERQRRQRAVEADKAYQRLMRNSGSGPATKTDPWGSIRGGEAPAKNSK